MNVYQKLRSIINSRLSYLNTDTSSINSAKLEELEFVLDQINLLENQETLAQHELMIEREVKMINECISAAADDEWKKQQQESFLYVGVPSFDQKSFEKILFEKGLKPQVA